MPIEPDRPDGAIDAHLPRSAAELRELFSRLDPGFAEVWETHLGRLLGRPGLDTRTRHLVLTSQYTVTRQLGPLAENIEAALVRGVATHEVLEVILQTYVYMGPWVVADACRVFDDILTRRGMEMPDMPARTTTPDGRDLQAERATWTDSDAGDPRIERLLDRYDWPAIANGLRLRPGHHLNMADTLDALDPEFLKTWLDAIYEGMYGRNVIDDRTRLLCVVAATLALGETHQSRRHMRGALRQGATPREVLEVIFHTTGFFGHPYVMPAAFDDLVLIADDEGRLEELVGDDRIDDVRRVVAARVQRRSGVQDGIGPA